VNIYDRITQDHDAAREVIGQIKETTSRAVKTRKELFDHLKLDMWVHHKVEEAVFYSYLRAGKEMHGEAMEAINEHHTANGLFEELDTFPVDSEEWLMKFKALSELVDHHMKEEEEDFFKKAKKVLSKEQAELMGQRFDQRKKVVMAALMPLDVKELADV
jgi:hemerythrin-like domain-containing protein